MVPSHRACGFAAGAALFPGLMGFSNWIRQATPGWWENKVAAGVNPAATAMLVMEPRWFPLIARAASPQALLSFRD